MERGVSQHTKVETKSISRRMLSSHDIHLNRNWGVNLQQERIDIGQVIDIFSDAYIIFMFVYVTHLLKQATASFRANRNNCQYFFLSSTNSFW